MRKWFRLLPIDARFFYAIHAIACLIAAFTVALNPTEYPAWIVLCVLLIQLFMSLISDQRAKAAYERGKWDERLWIANSLEEAAVRGMSPQQWFDSFVERVIAEERELHE